MRVRMKTRKILAKLLSDRPKPQIRLDKTTSLPVVESRIGRTVQTFVAAVQVVRVAK